MQSDNESNEQGIQTPPITPTRNFVEGVSLLNINISDESDSTFSKLRYKGKKMRSLEDIYNQAEENADIRLDFALFSCHPLYFEEAIKEDK